MSFKENDNKHMINLNNYEEYFLLYVDGELNAHGMKEVDDFVNNHSDLKSELEVLLATRLSPDDITIDKKELYSFSMDKLTNEELLLSFIDDELSNEEKRKIQERISSGVAFQNEYELLLKTKLDPSEVIAYPNKEELYKRTRKIIPFSPWLRAAAIFILVAAGFIIYEKRSSVEIKPSTAGIIPTRNNQPKQTNTVPDKYNTQTISNENTVKTDNLAVLPSTTTNKKSAAENKDLNRSKAPDKVLVATNDLIKDPVVPFKNPGKDRIETSPPTTLIAYVPASETINKSAVTSALSQRTNSSSVPTTDPDPGTTVATHSDRKGSFKSFLRKAARVIEKKTGIDPANDNDELLIGAVALKIN
jgi:hypothetical protein